MKDSSKKIGIIGAGPAGIAAAIQLKRSGYTPLLFEKNRCGGLLRNAHLVENYPGYYEGISGQALSDDFIRHLAVLKIEPIYKSVQSLDYIETDAKYMIQCNQSTYHLDRVIVASGLKPKKPSFLNTLTSYQQQHIFFEVSEIPNEPKKDILIVGAGDAAFDYSLSLTAHHNITIINRSNYIKALDLLVQRAKYAGIPYEENIQIKSLEPTTDGYLVKMEKMGSPNVTERFFNLILIAIGREPDIAFISSQILKKRVKLEAEKSFFLIGDIINGANRQTSIAVGDGIKAAMEIANIEG